MSALPLDTARIEQLWLQQRIDQLNAAYAAALDEMRFDDWPAFFVPQGRYKVQARENFDRGLPLALMALESQGMMRDRVYGVTPPIYHRPQYPRPGVTPPRRLGHLGAGAGWRPVTGAPRYAKWPGPPAGRHAGWV